MYKAFTFVYDDVSSSNYNLKLLRIDDKDAYTTGSSVPPKSFTMCKTNLSSKQNIVGVTVDDTLEFPVQVLFDWEEGEHPDGVSRNVIGKIRKWLFNQTDFKKLVILQPDMQDKYFEAIFINPQDLMLEGQVIGFSGTVKCNNTGAYKNKKLKKNVTGTKVYHVLNETDGIFDTPLNIKIEAGASGIEDFFFVVNGEGIAIDHVPANCVITIDTETLMVEASDAFDVYDNFNMCFPQFKSGMNTVTVGASEGATVTVEWKEIVEVGV